MWAYTAYTLQKLFEMQPQRKRKMEFRELRKIFLEILPHESGIIPIDKPADLYVELLELEIMGVIEISGITKELDERTIKITDEEKLIEIAKKVEELPSATGMRSFRKYMQIIDKGVERLSRPT